MPSAVILFLKYPEPGRVKTRLVATVGAEAAATAYRQLVRHVCAQLPPRAAVHVFFDPPEEETRVGEWLGPLLGRPFSLTAQAAGDLGERLQAAFDEVFARGASSAIVAGTDCVEMTQQSFAAAEAVLTGADVALGPTHDGGYYLLALKRPQPALFQAIEWSSPRTLEQTLARAAAAGLTVKLLETCHDVDDEAGWHRAQRMLANGP